MTQRSFPFNNSDTWEDSWTKMARLWLGTGVIQGALNELQCYADSSGMQVKVKSGRSWDLGHWYENDAELVLPIATAHATLPRIDRVVRRIDWVANSITLAILQGVPAASPTPPALTQVDGTKWEESISQVRVDAGVATIAGSKVIPEFDFAQSVLKVGADKHVSAKGNAILANNCYFDGVNWNRYDTSKPAYLLYADLGTGKPYYSTASAGANPIAWTSNEIWHQGNNVLNVGAGTFGAAGYEKLPNGRIRQWGSVTVSGANVGQNVTLPIQFPNQCLNVKASCPSIDSYGGAYYVSTSQIGVWSNHNGAAVHWEAIGW